MEEWRESSNAETTLGGEPSHKLSASSALPALCLIWEAVCR